MFKIGQHQISNSLVLAPMAGITDLPFRRLCLGLGAGMAVGEMVSSDIGLYASRKSTMRLVQDDLIEPRAIQIIGTNPRQMALAAVQNYNLGAQIIDINMGCPAKKVLKKAAGSALMRDELLVAEILRTTVQSVDIPVTLKIRTGWSQSERNAVNIARIAENEGIQCVSVHGRSREDRFLGNAEYDTIAAVKQAISIPVIANGDIDSGAKAAKVLAHTQADGLMVGRAARGNPWIFSEINHFLNTGKQGAKPTLSEITKVMLNHLAELHQFYGPVQGVRVARKHISWYLNKKTASKEFLSQFFKLNEPDQQIQNLRNYLSHLEQVQETPA